jgi:hypothetical protein
MNEKIKELEEQCWEPKQYGPPWFNSKKFAELLIEQCVVCVRYTDKDHIFTAHDAGVVGAAHDRAMKAIRKHFGV